MRNYPGNGSQVRYEEGLAVGYRHFDQAEVAPHYPFGFGLSYTTFSIATPQATIDAIGNGTVSTRVKNTGRVAGKDVVQLYIRPIAPKISRPLRELRGFRKVDLKPGASVEVSIPLVARDFAWFDPERGSWRVDAGRYEILVGSHSRSLVGTVVSISADHEIRLGRSYSA